MFNSNILMESFVPSKKTNKPLTEIASKTMEYPYEMGLLELNDMLHDIETEYQIKKYRGFVESVNAENNGITVYNEGVGELFEGIIKAIQAIIKFVKDFIKNLFGFQKKTTEGFNRKKAETRGFSFDDQNILNQTRTFTIYHYPDMSKIDPNAPRGSLNNITPVFDRVCRGQDADMANEAHEKMAFKVLRKLLKADSEKHEFNGPVENADAFKKYVNTDLVYVTKKEMTVKEWTETVVNKVLREHVPDTFVAEKTKLMLDNLKRLEVQLKQSKDNLDPQSIKVANSYLAIVKRVVDSWCWYINLLSKTFTTQLRYIVAEYEKIKNTSGKNESASIHGEEFNSDTLFDNEDMRDFNRTEWMDLQLTTECYELKFEMMEAHRRIAIQEALILADDKPNKVRRIKAMREAEESKLKFDASKIIEQIKTLINKFMDTAREKISINANFIKENENELKAKAFSPDRKFTSKGDILAGMYRVQEPISFVPFDYNRMKDDLSSKEAFFQKYIMNSLNKSSQYSKRDVKWQDGMSIADFCKAYYGASMPDDKYPGCEITGKEFEANKQNIVNFLKNPNFIASIKRDMSKIEAESKKSASTVASGAADSDTQDTGSSDAGSETRPAATQESYISALYGGAILTEIDIDTSKEADKDQNNGNGNSSANESSGIKTYINAYKDVMMSKITASEFIISEMMQVMRNHIGKTNSEQKSNAAQNAQNGNPQQQNNQQ